MIFEWFGCTIPLAMHHKAMKQRFSFKCSFFSSPPKYFYKKVESSHRIELYDLWMVWMYDTIGYAPLSLAKNYDTFAEKNHNLTYQSKSITTLTSSCVTFYHTVFIKRSFINIVPAITMSTRCYCSTRAKKKLF